MTNQLINNKIALTIWYHIREEIGTWTYLEL